MAPIQKGDVLVIPAPNNDSKKGKRITIDWYQDKGKSHTGDYYALEGKNQTQGNYLILQARAVTIRD